MGNVYYHFRTKDALIEAVIQAHVQELQSMFARWEHVSEPRQRLLGLLRTARDEGHVLYGLDAREVAKTIGASINEDPLYLQATGFVLRPDGTVADTTNFLKYLQKAQ